MQNTKYLGYQALEQAQTPQLLTKKTNQQRFWKKYQPHELLSKHSGFTVYSISANHNDKELMLFAHGRSVSLVDTKHKQITREFANFDTNITSVMLRRDGSVMAIGDQVGRIQVMDTKEKFRLRSFKNHKKRINCLQFQHFGGQQHLYSVSDDMTLRQYDVAAGNVIASYDQIHQDYIKCVRSINNNTVITGGYDKIINMFDMRSAKNPVASFTSQFQVEWMDIFSSSLSFVACGQKKISLWDVRKNTILNSHTAGKKTISCVKIALDGSRILTSSLDNHFKAFKSDTLQLTFQQKFESPITTFQLNKSNLCIGFGLENKKMLLKSRNTNPQKLQDENQSEQQVEDQIAQWFQKNLSASKKQSSLNSKYFYRGIYEKPTSYQIMFERNQNKKVSDYDKMLKKFQYKKAFTVALRKKNIAIFLALVDQYVQRGCLDRTIKTFSEKQFQQIVYTLSGMLTDVRHTHVTLMLLSKLIEFHPNKLQSECGRVLKKTVEEQLQSISEMKIVSGMLELIENNCI